MFHTRRGIYSWGLSQAARGAFPAVLLQSRSSRQARPPSVPASSLSPAATSPHVRSASATLFFPVPIHLTLLLLPSFGGGCSWIFAVYSRFVTLSISVAFPSRAAFVFIYTVPDIDIYGSSSILRLLRVPMTVITELREICSRHCHGYFCYEHDLNLFLINEIHGDISLNKAIQTCAIRQVSDTCNRAESIIVQCN